MSKILKGVAIAAVAFFAPYLLSFTGFMIGASAITVLNAFGVSAFISGIAAQLARRPSRPPTTTAYNGTVEPRRIIYGEQLVSGMNVIPPVTSGNNNKYLHKVLAIAGHEVNAMSAVYFNQEAVGTIGSITGTANDGLVSTGTYANKAWLRRYMGTSTQTVDYILDTALTIWTSTHRGRGVAYLAIQLEEDEKVYKTGVPEITVLVQGMKVYDPRLDSTNGGVGAHRYATPSTWSYSTNPALCLANYLIDTALGMGETAATRIDWPLVITAADECDEMVTCPNGSGGSTTQRRYTCNAVFYATESYQQIIGAIAGAMLGTCLYSGGKWRMMAGAWSSSAFSLGDANIIDSGITLTTAYEYQERYNGIRGTFTDTANNYQTSEFPAVSSASYVSADGESVFKDVRFDACSNVYEAQRAAILLVRKSRNRQSATLTCDMSAFKIRPGETGIVTCSELGWSNKTVRCEGWKFNPSGYLEVAVREELSSDWNDPILGDYTEPLAISNVTPVYFTPDAPTGLVVSGTSAGISLKWTAPALVPSGSRYQVYEYTANTPFSSASLVWEGIATTAFLQKADQTTRYYWVAIIMPWETVPHAAAEYPSGNGLPGTSMAVTGWIATGNCAMGDLSASKVGGSSSYDSSVYSTAGYTKCHLVVQPAQTNKELMVGLNTDPATDSGFTSIDYAWLLDGGGGCAIYESGGSVGSFGSYTASTVFAVTYDAATVTYLKDGRIQRTVSIASLTLYADSSFYSADGILGYLEFGPGVNAPPVVDRGWIATGSAVISGDTISKTANAATWDSAVYSAKGYTSAFVQWKPSDVSSGRVMVALTTDPLASTSYTTLDYAWYNDNGTATIYENGSSVATYGVCTTDTVFAITYDGATVTYWKDGVSMRTVAIASLTLYMGSAQYDIGKGANSIKFGPGSVRPLVSTGSLSEFAAAESIESTDSTHTTAVGNFGTENVLTYTTAAQPVDHVLTATVSMDVWNTSVNDRWVEFSITRAPAFWIAPQRKIVAAATPGDRIQIQISADAVADTTYDVFVDLISLTGAAGVVEARNVNLRVEHIKR